MNKINLFLATAIIVCVFGGCSSTGLSVSSHHTNVELSSNNYHIVATNVSGESISKGVLGMSYGVGLGANQLAIVPLTNDRALYRKAIQMLWSNFETKYGKVDNRALALVNVRYDSETLNTFIYTKIKVVVVADVVEFE